MSRRPTEAEVARVMEIAGDMYWRQRFGLAQTANVVIVRRKDSASTSPPAGNAMARQEHGLEGERAGSDPCNDLACAEHRPASCHPRRGAGRHHSTDNAAHRGIGGTTCP